MSCYDHAECNQIPGRIAVTINSSTHSHLQKTRKSMSMQTTCTHLRMSDRLADSRRHAVRSSHSLPSEYAENACAIKFVCKGIPLAHAGCRSTIDYMNNHARLSVWVHACATPTCNCTPSTTYKGLMTGD